MQDFASEVQKVFGKGGEKLKEVKVSLTVNIQSVTNSVMSEWSFGVIKFPQYNLLVEVQMENGQSKQNHLSMAPISCHYFYMILAVHYCGLLLGFLL